ncbi:UPF0481 protein At3g47200-like isoform X1 [Ziziphus jujuba]|uniref:UPF0481 protein At3g47200-like isoform X1 n=1 Tax=Ziziphus jujuba TaxID=326968 RepID=A0ABM3IS41_ZIZJJ|nr:UPF0481 protein At3g47200-like isoform X1 [Ziziphus jujuba]
MKEEKVSKNLPHKQIIINISEKLEDRSDWIIYKVPKKLRARHEEAYTPQLVSIGPFHHGESSLKAMEHYKAKCMNDFLGRYGITMKKLMGKFEKDECKLVKEIQRSYGDESFEPENKQEYLTDLIPMILQDACFILELFHKKYYYNKYNRGDYKLSPWVEAAIKQDLILLENQIPFIVLTQLFECIGEPLDFLIEITFEFFIDYYRFGKPCTKEGSKKKHLCKYPEKEQLVNKMKHIRHFTDLVRKFICDDTVRFPDSDKDVTHCLYSAKQLNNAGVMFSCPEDGKYLASIETWPDEGCQWWKGRGCCWISCLELKIPQLKVQDNTECIFRNVMALEQFSYPNEPRVCNYIFLLDQLIDTVEDVDLLVDKKIIENWLGTNKDVADLVNKLCDQIVTPCFFYDKICGKLNEHHEKKLNVARSTLKRVYFKDIWTGSGTVVGLVFLVFSLFSTYSTIKNLFFVGGKNMTISQLDKVSSVLPY